VWAALFCPLFTVQEGSNRPKTAFRIFDRPAI
jgi:hypothetical protein